MFKRIILLAAFCLGLAMPGMAVLQEANMAQSLKVLNAELEKKYKEQSVMIAQFGQRKKIQRDQLMKTIQQSNETAMMLYSQDQNYTFDIAYACHQATEQYNQYTSNRGSYDQIEKYLSTEIARYQNLIFSLETMSPMIGAAKDSMMKNMDAMMARHGRRMPPKPKNDSASIAHRKAFMLDDLSQGYRNASIIYAQGILANLRKFQNDMSEDNEQNLMVQKKLKKANDYANNQYKELQNSIFVTGSTNYPDVIKRLPMMLGRASKEMGEKYFTASSKNISSQWSGSMVFGLVIASLFYIMLAGVVGNVIVRLLIPKRFRTDSYNKKKPMIVMSVGILVFAIVMSIAKMSTSNDFLSMAFSLLIEYAWLMGAICLSVLVRLDDKQIATGFYSYVPIMLLGFIIISFRIIFIPNDVIDLVMFPLVAIFCVIKLISVRKISSNLPKSDKFYSWTSFTVMFVSAICSFKGYNLLAVQIIIWWLFQLAIIQTITLVFHILNKVEVGFLAKKILAKSEKAKAAQFKAEEAKVEAEKVSEPAKEADEEKLKQEEEKNKFAENKKIENVIKSLQDKKVRSKYITSTWIFDLLERCIVPMCAVYSLVISIFWAADLFNLTEFCRTIFITNFVNVEGVISLSIMKITIVGAMYFLFKYINYVVKSVYMKYLFEKQQKVKGNVEANSSLFNNLTSIFLWGLYFILILFILQVPKSGISIVTAGLATGIGFAMKDLLENFFYGISLMAGRVHVGDWIECDGVRGKVKEITYQSTQIETLDGCVIAFLNSSLFNKNFKNLTTNHVYELVILPVGISYGSDVAQVREYLIDAVTKCNYRLETGHDAIEMKGKLQVKVVFGEFADSSINLNVVFYSDVEKKFWIVGAVKEAIYNTLNAHNIEIPFPQRDLHVINPGSAEGKAVVAGL